MSSDFSLKSLGDCLDKALEIEVGETVCFVYEGSDLDGGGALSFGEFVFKFEVDSDEDHSIMFKWLKLLEGTKDYVQHECCLSAGATVPYPQILRLNPWTLQPSTGEARSKARASLLRGMFRGSATYREGKQGLLPGLSWR